MISGNGFYAQFNEYGAKDKLRPTRTYFLPVLFFGNDHEDNYHAYVPTVAGYTSHPGLAPAEYATDDELVIICSQAEKEAFDAPQTVPNVSDEPTVRQVLNEFEAASADDISPEIREALADRRLRLECWFPNRPDTAIVEDGPSVSESIVAAWRGRFQKEEASG